MLVYIKCNKILLHNFTVKYISYYTYVIKNYDGGTMKTKLFLTLLIMIVLLSSPVSAVQVGTGVDFQTTGTGTNYHVSTAFNCTNITVYSTAWNINGGNITTYQNVNMSMESLTNATHLNFTNNATITNLTVTDNFANYTVTSGEVYGLYYQTNDTKADQTVAGSQIYFTSIAAGSWYITPSDSVWSGAGATSPIKNGETSTVVTQLEDPTDTFDSVRVKIEGTNHTMQKLADGSYRYLYTDTSIIKKHYITDFYAHNSGGWTSIGSSLYIDVLSASGGGGGGGITYPSAEEPEEPTVEPPTVPSVEEGNLTLQPETYIEDAESYLMGDAISMFRFNFGIDQPTFSKRVYNIEIVDCSAPDNSIIELCTASGGYVTVDVSPRLTGIYNTYDDYALLTNENGSIYHAPFRVAVFDFMGPVPIPEIGIGGLPDFMFVNDPVNGTVTGIRLWVVLLIGALAMLYAGKKLKEI